MYGVNKQSLQDRKYNINRAMQNNDELRQRTSEQSSDMHTSSFPNINVDHLLLHVLCLYC